jgi:hypothetical protein
MVTRKTPAVRIACSAAFLVLALALVPVALAGKGQGGGGKPSGGGTCTPSAPGVVVQNTFAWGQWGSWGFPGQKLGYFVQVINYDSGCGSSSFAVTVSTPSGFSVSIPTNTISLASGASGYLWAYVTAPSAIADGNYALTATATRSSTSTAATGSSSTYYRVYSSDSVAPTLFWANPGDGTTVTGRSYNVAVSSSDDHAVQKIDLYIDNVYKSESLCDDVSYTCPLNYSWSLSGVTGQHTATFKSYDWMGNVGVSTVTFTVA